MEILNYIGESFVGHSYHFWCDCLIKMDITGKVSSFYISNKEIVLIIKTNTKELKVGLNTPTLKIEPIF